MEKFFARFLTNFLRVVRHFQAIFVSLFLINFVGALVISLAENLRYGDALYFTFVTGLTIGYGDIVVKTALGRSVALFLGFIGILFTGLVIAAAVEAVRRTYHRQ
jgi:voltage-gated potassium channel